MALLFIGITQSPQAATRATLVMPLTQGLNGIFMLTYMHLARRGLSIALGTALVIWFLLAGLIAVLDIQVFSHSVLIWIVLVLVCGGLAEKGMRIPAQRGAPVKQTPATMLLRALFGGAAVAAAVFFAKLGGVVYGGILATFPAMLLATLIVVHRVRGAEFGRAMAKALMVSGLINVALYAMVVRAAYPTVGLVPGTLIGFLAALGASFVIHQFLRKSG